MTWRLAQSLVVLRDQINAMYPDRNKGTDGALSGYTYGPGEVVVNPGNPSSHNINSEGVVCAFDFTTGDYPGGISVADGMALAEAIRLELLVAPRGLDAYVIHHMEPPYVPYPGPWIADSGNNWEWVPYSGDPHTSHIHVSVDYDIYPGGAPSGLCPYDMTDPWNLGNVSPQSGTITPIEKDWFDMATQADLEAAVLNVLTNTRFVSGNRNIFDGINMLSDNDGQLPARVLGFTFKLGNGTVTNLPGILEQISTKAASAAAPTNVTNTVAALSSADLAALAKAVNDEADKRARARLGA